MKQGCSSSGQRWSRATARFSIPWQMGLLWARAQSCERRLNLGGGSGGDFGPLFPSAGGDGVTWQREAPLPGAGAVTGGRAGGTFAPAASLSSRKVSYTAELILRGSGGALLALFTRPPKPVGDGDGPAGGGWSHPAGSLRGPCGYPRRPGPALPCLRCGGARPQPGKGSCASSAQHQDPSAQGLLSAVSAPREALGGRHWSRMGSARALGTPSAPGLQRPAMLGEALRMPVRGMLVPALLGLGHSPEPGYGAGAVPVGLSWAPARLGPGCFPAELLSLMWESLRFSSWVQKEVQHRGGHGRHRRILWWGWCSPAPCLQPRAPALCPPFRCSCHRHLESHPCWDPWCCGRPAQQERTPGGGEVLGLG